MKSLEKIVDEHIGKLELRGSQVWMCYEAVPWGLKWRPVVDLAPLINMVREGLVSGEVDSGRGRSGHVRVEWDGGDTAEFLCSLCCYL